MKNALQIGILLSIFSSLSACGTFIGRSEPRPVEGEYYNSTKGDLLLLGLNNSNSEAHGATVMCWMMVVCPLITVVSLPLDVAIDTLLLPVDALSDRDDKKTDQ
tara:strand:- start:1335 stop:1646 length:312 start_codon:yes stop_codon:yes gene_type:complete